MSIFLLAVPLPASSRYGYTPGRQPCIWICTEYGPGPRVERVSGTAMRRPCRSETDNVTAAVVGQLEPDLSNCPHRVRDALRELQRSRARRAGLAGRPPSHRQEFQRHVRIRPPRTERPRPYRAFTEVTPIVPNHVSTNSGQRVMADVVRRRPNAWPPRAYRWYSTETPAFFKAR